MSAENTLYLPSTPKLGGKELDFPLFHHLPSQGRVLHKIPGFALILPDQSEFVDPALRFDGIEENRMEYGYLPLRGLNPRTQRNVPEDIHDLGDVDVIWASNATRVTGRAYPDGMRGEDLLPEAELNHSNNLIREDVHGIGHGAPS